MNNIVNQVAYLRTTRQFPEEMRQLTVELTKSYMDIANAINNRVISIFPTNRPAITGENWFFTNQRQQTFRQVYPFGSFVGTLSIPHGIEVSEIPGFTKIYGIFTNGTNWYPLPYVDVIAVNNQINVIITPSQIVITGGGGAGQPVILRGWIVLEWLSQI